MARRLGWSAGFVQGGTKDAHVPVLGRWLPLDSGVLGWGVLLQSFKSVLGPGWRAASGHPTAAHPRLHICGEVQCVPLQFCEGNGGVLQVVEEDLDLWGDGETEVGPLTVRPSPPCRAEKKCFLGCSQVCASSLPRLTLDSPLLADQVPLLVHSTRGCCRAKGKGQEP